MAEQINSKLHSQQHANNNNSRQLQHQRQQHQQQQQNGADGDNGKNGPGDANVAKGGSLQSNDSVDLDNLFAFLSEVQPNASSNAIIDEIGEKMNTLVEDLDVELESVIQQEIEGLTSERNNNVAAPGTTGGAKAPPLNGIVAGHNGGPNVCSNNNNNNNSYPNKPTTPKPIGG